MKTGDEVNFDTLLENNGSEDSPPVIMALNIIKLSGDVVDPEDWSPERTQQVDFVPAGDQIRHSWTIEAILKGDYMVYLVAVPEPGRRRPVPISSPGLHLVVGAFQRLNPQGVLPVVIAVPLGVTLALLVLVRLRPATSRQAVPDTVEDGDRVDLSTTRAPLACCHARETARPRDDRDRHLRDRRDPPRVLRRPGRSVPVAGDVGFPSPSETKAATPPPSDATQAPAGRSPRPSTGRTSLAPRPTSTNGCP